MVDQRSTSRGFLKPVIGGLATLAALILAIYFRVELWDFIKRVGRVAGDWMTNWVPDHPGETFAIVIFAVAAFAINWVAHVRGRLRAWVFALVVEFGLWLLFWYGAGIPPLKELVGLGGLELEANAVLLSGLIVIGLTGAVFWFLEAREEWNKYRRRHNAEDD